MNAPSDRPAWSSAFEDLPLVSAVPLGAAAREWAWGGATGAGVKVAIVDSGVNGGHPSVGGVNGYVAVVRDDDADQGVRFEDDPHDDLVGHGTACAGIIRSLAPECDIYSVRVLGANLKGQGALLMAGIEWAVEQGIDVVNMSLSSKSEAMFAPLHDIADEAYFHGSVLVCAANNVPGPTYPSQFASVVSVAAMPGDDPWDLAYNPRPPVEFGARGIDVEVAWPGPSNEHGSIVATGNSFAAPHVAGLVTLIRSKHPALTPFQIKTVLQACSRNAG
jgi:subtilisin